MGEQLHYLFEMCFELILRKLEAILSQNIIRIRGQDFCDGEVANLKINESLKSLGSLDFKGSVSFKAILDNMHKLIEHIYKLNDNLTGSNDFFNSKCFAILVCKCNTFQSFSSLFGDVMAELIADWLEAPLFFFVKLIEKFDVIVSLLTDELAKTISLIQELSLWFDQHLLSESLKNLLTNIPSQNLLNSVLFVFTISIRNF
jgi:hypothetical protein